jgi:hypothetical protein
MPGATANLALPYPIPDDSVDVPRDVKALADKLDLSLGSRVLSAAPVLDVGVTGQVRAGRQLTAADFTDLGLTAPAGLWNLSNLTDASGNGRTLTNKNAVTFAGGINGTAATAAQFRGASGTPANDPALYIADTGAADPFRIRTGSWGCWARTAKRSTIQILICKDSPTAGTYGWLAYIGNSNTAVVGASPDGATAPPAIGTSDLADDRWHFIVGTYDGTTIRTYVDGVLEGTASVAGTIFQNTRPLNIGGRGADGSTATDFPHYGRIDEAFVTADVLTEDQIRVLYAARIAHTLGTTPRSATLSVNRRRKGAAFAVADFTTQPLRLYNLTSNATGASWEADLGSNGVPLVYQGGSVVGASGADGTGNGALSFATGSVATTDAGLPAALTARSYGCWFKTTTATVTQGAFAWATGNGAALYTVSGTVRCASLADEIAGPYVADGQWHSVVAVEDNAAGDGVRRKLYLDGRLVNGSTVLNSITLAGANRFRIGAMADGTFPWTGQIDGVFVTGYALTTADIATLYAKSSQGLGASPKNAGDHVERMDATAVYLIADTLDSQHQIDLGVAS